MECDRKEMDDFEKRNIVIKMNRERRDVLDKISKQSRRESGVNLRKLLGYGSRTLILNLYDTQVICETILHFVRDYEVSFEYTEKAYDFVEYIMDCTEEVYPTTQSEPDGS